MVGQLAGYPSKKDIVYRCRLWLGQNFIKLNVSFVQHSSQNMPVSPVEKIGDRRKRIMKAMIQMYIFFFFNYSRRVTSQAGTLID
jgi:hypothetical protein